MIKSIIGTAVNILLFLVLLGFCIKLYQSNNKLARQVKDLSVSMANEVSGLKRYLPKVDELISDFDTKEISNGQNAKALPKSVDRKELEAVDIRNFDNRIEQMQEISGSLRNNH